MKSDIVERSIVTLSCYGSSISIRHIVLAYMGCQRRRNCTRCGCISPTNSACAFPEIFRVASTALPCYRDVKSNRTGLHLRPECCLRVSTLVRGIPFTLPARATACRRRLTIRGEARRARVVAIFLQFVSVFFLPRRKSSRLDSPDVSTPARDIDPWRFSLRNSRINNDTSWGGGGIVPHGLVVPRKSEVEKGR